MYAAEYITVLKRYDAARQTEERYLDILQAKTAKVCDVPQEKGVTGAWLHYLNEEDQRSLKWLKMS